MADSNFLGNLKGKVALITGSSSGIGAATALEFAKQGICLTLHGRNVERLAKVKQQCLELGLKENEILVVTGDIISADEMKLVAETILNHFGTVDILVNNAGYGIVSNLSTTTADQMDTMFQQHVKTPLLLIQLLKDEIIKNKGSIVNIASINGQAANPSSLPYSIAKAAMIQLTAIVNAELGPKGVRCNSICPGYTLTRCAQTSGVASSEEESKKFLANGGKNSLVGYACEPEEIARSILFTVSQAAPYMIGQHITIDGGYLENRVFLSK